MTINEAIKPLRHVAWLAKCGPPMLGQQVYQEQIMHTLTYKVKNGTNINGADMPFGYFVQIEPHDSNESRLVIIFAPLDESGNPVFNVRTTKLTNINEFICGATSTTQIVPPATNPDSGENIWESVVKPIDDKHSEKTTVTVTSLNSNMYQDEWDEMLSVSVRVLRTLTQTGGVASISVVGGLVTRVTYESVRCGWYVQSTESFAAVSRSYGTTVDYYWPAVLTDLLEWIYDRKPEAGGGSEVYITGEFSKEAYHGPCKATVTETWSVTAPTVDAPTFMQPLPIDISTPFASKSFGPTLHGAAEFHIVINESEIYEDVNHTYNYSATTPTSRPSTAIASDSVDPVRGGYLRRKIVVDEPA